jgi:hypothetical protein
MDTHSTDATLEHLLEQLGLSSDEASLNAFVSEHGPLPATVRIAEAPFWNESQAAFLQEAIAQDALWAPAVDQLDVLFRK